MPFREPRRRSLGGYRQHWKEGKHRRGRSSRSSTSQEANAYWSSLFQTSSLAPWERAGNGMWVQTPWRLCTMLAGHFEIEEREDDRGNSTDAGEICDRKAQKLPRRKQSC